MVTLLLQGVEEINEGYDFASAGSRKVNDESYDFASTGSQKINEWPRPCFYRGSSAKTNVTLLLQGVNISKLLDQDIIFY